VGGPETGPVSGPPDPAPSPPDGGAGQAALVPSDGVDLPGRVTPGGCTAEDPNTVTDGGGAEGTDGGEDTACLFRRACDGDRVAWDVLVSRYTTLLWRIARAHHLAPADASDVVQTTWLRLVEHADRITDPERLGGWLATTARRECLRILRLSRRERPHPDDHDAFEETRQADPPPDTHLLTRERDALLWSGMATLPERSRVLLEVLMAETPPSYDDIAEALDMPRGSIGPTRARSLARLRQFLEDEG
jgi:RNA polymerase sigma factor (sigma-70 family)